MISHELEIEHFAGSSSKYWATFFRLFISTMTTADMDPNTRNLKKKNTELLYLLQFLVFGRVVFAVFVHNCTKF